MPHFIKSFGYNKENCPHLIAFLKSLINFVNNKYKLHYSGIPWTKTTLKLIKETNQIKKIKKMKKGYFLTDLR